VRYRELSSFEKGYGKLSEEEKERVKKSLLQLVDAFEKHDIPAGLGLKKLFASLWELRVGLKVRVIFILKKDIVEWGFAGTHEDIRRFMKGAG